MHVTGPLGIAADSSDAFAGIDSTLLYAALAVVIVLLLLTYRSPVLWLLPVASVGVALIAAQALIYLLARHAGLTVNAMSAGILSVLVFGAGTDYALLLTSRYREELRRHTDRHEAMAIALRRAGPAIIASAATVALALLALMVAELNSTSGMGPVLAIGVVVALAAMLTLLPALLVITGRWVFWPRRPAFGSAEPTSSGVWSRVGRAIAIRPRLTWISSAVVLGVMALGIISLNATGLSNAESFRGKPESVAGEQILARHFPAGAGQPVIVMGNASAGAQLAAPDSQAANAAIDRARATVVLSFGAALGVSALVAFGILLDTLLVRSVMVTALSLDLGRWMWWPGKLARRRDPGAPAAEHEIPSVQAGQAGH